MLVDHVEHLSRGISVRNSRKLLETITLVRKITEEKSWFWSIDAIAGEHHHPVKINGPLQKNIWTLVWEKSTEEKSWFWKQKMPLLENIIFSQDLWTTSRGLSGLLAAEGEGKILVLEHDASCCRNIIFQSRFMDTSTGYLDKEEEKVEENRVRNVKKVEERKLLGSLPFQIFPAWMAGKKNATIVKKKKRLDDRDKTYDQWKSVRNGARKHSRFWTGDSGRERRKKSWFWSIDVIAGEHHLPVNIYGPLQRDIQVPANVPSANVKERREKKSWKRIEFEMSKGWKRKLLGSSSLSGFFQPGWLGKKTPP
ncbi:hypothetical protein CEXT_179621 [Caerostris extrusa]|uniref:DUF4283 domain-containing protein n=1 Tax=Caerostris extrusa TaxID=172846 RepID=A0AAV4XUH0_CAEEX|nr:hypothetical protein CEXT_179621 [Caerostris extrusa]